MTFLARRRLQTASPSFIKAGSNNRVPETIFFHPGTEVVSEFIGRPNILACDKCCVLSSGLVEITSGDLRMVLPYEGDMIDRIAISPHDIYISNTKPPGPTLNRYQAIVTEIIRHGSQVRVRVSIGRTSLVAELTEGAFDEMDITEGSEIYMVIKLRRLRYVESKRGAVFSAGKH